MSKMSELHMELSEQATELGFESLDMALANGYDIDYQSRTLVNGQELAHKAWLMEKEELLARADKVWEDPKYDDLLDLVGDLVDFIKKGEI